MRKTLTVAMLALLVPAFFGCANGKNPLGDTREERCQKYEAVYSAYLASTAVRPVSKEESAGAMVAAAFLKMYCGWAEPAPKPGTKAPPQTKDANGVPILVPPSAPKARDFSVTITPRRGIPAKKTPNDPDGLFVFCEDGSVVRIPVP